jgi:hypothetical protein
MSNHKSTVERYIEGFNRADNDQILSRLTEVLTLDRLIEEGDGVVATGAGR